MVFWKKTPPAPTLDQIKDFLLNLTHGEGLVTKEADVVVLSDPKREPLLSFRVSNSIVRVSVSYTLDAPTALTVLSDLGEEFDWEYDSGFILNSTGTKLTGQAAAAHFYEREMKKSLAAQNFEALMPTNRGVSKHDLH